MLILDTNVLSELMKPSPDRHVARWLSTLDDARLATTTITCFEIAYGLERLATGKRQTTLQQRFEALCAPLVILSFEPASATLAGQFRALRDLVGLPTTASDMMIAGIAAAHDAILATRNAKDFTQLPIRVINPWNYSDDS